MTEERIYPLQPGNTGKDVSGIEIVIVGDEGSYEIRARKTTTVVLCPSDCPGGSFAVNGSEVVFTLVGSDGDYRVVVSGKFNVDICPSDCPVNSLLQ